jgi:hypothetical protein
MTTMKSWLIGKFHHHHHHQLVNAPPNAGGVTDSFQQGIMKEKRGVHFPKIVNEDDKNQKSHAASSSTKTPTTTIPRITVEDDDNLLEAVGSTTRSKTIHHPRLSKSEMNLTNSSSSLLTCESNSSLSHPPPASSSSIPRLLAEVIRQATTTTTRRRSCDLQEDKKTPASRAGMLIRVISGRDPSVQSQLLFNPRRTSQPWHNLVRDLARAVNVNGNLSRIQTLYGRKVNHQFTSSQQIITRDNY